MPELRKDPVSGRWVIIASDRSNRPHLFPKMGAAPRTDPSVCPFCPGHEEETPSELFALRTPGTLPDHPGWTVRSMPNKFPALRIEGDLNREGVGVYDKMNGVGAHEVIVETPNHDEDLVDLSPERIAAVLEVCQIRVNDLANDERFRFVLLFKNQGESAGASVGHAHTQLIATPVIPKRVLEELEGARYYYNHRERCIFCDIVKQELSDGSRLVDQTPRFIALAPFAARFPFEVWVMPKPHQAAFRHLGAVDRLEFATLLRRVLRRHTLSIGNAAFNYMFHSSPFGLENNPEYHWHLEIIPRLTNVAGFEWGTGFYINPTPPEEAAAAMRAVDPESFGRTATSSLGARET